MALVTNEITYLQLINMFEVFATDHANVNSFGNGAFAQLTESLEEGDWDYNDYVKLWVADNVPVVDFDDGQVTYNFQIFLMDVQHDKDENIKFEAQIKSNLIYTYKDFLAFLKVEPKILGNDVRIFSLGSSSGVSFTQRFDDNLVGVVFDISIVQPVKYNKCEIPLA